MLLSNSIISLSVSELGAELISLKKDEHEYIWTGDKSFWARHAPILFPIVGKVYNNEYISDNQLFKLNQHGFARDSRFEMIDDNTLRLTSSEETLKVYPFRFELIANYTLDNNTVIINWKVRNTDNKTIYFQIGAHPGFNYPDFNAEDSVHAYFELYKNDKIVDEIVVSSLNNGYVIKDHHENMKIDNARLPLNAELFSNDALVIERQQLDKVVMLDKEGNHYLTLTCKDANVFGLWSPYKQDCPFCCIEPWCGRADTQGFTDDISHKDYIQSLQPNEVFEFEYRIIV